MTTYTTPHFANGLSDRNVRTASDKESINRARAVNPAVTRNVDLRGQPVAGLSDVTADWQPDTSKGVPKAAIGALGAALVGGVALAIVLLAPAKTVTKVVQPDPIAAAHDTSSDPVSTMNRETPAAGPATPTPTEDATATELRAQAAGTAAQSAAATAPAAVPAPAATLAAPAAPRTIVAAPRAVRRLDAPTAAPMVTAPTTPTQTLSAPVITPDAPVVSAPVVAPQVEQQPAAMQQTPAAPTVSPSLPSPVPTLPTPDAGPAPVPAPGGTPQ